MDKISLVTLLIGSVLPYLVGLVTNVHWAGWVKGTVLLAFSAVNGVGHEFLASPDKFDLSGSVWNAGGSFVVGVVLHEAILGKTKFSRALQNALYPPQSG